MKLMITKFKIYEKQNLYSNTFDWYKGKWYIHYNMNHEYNWEEKLGYIILINKVENDNTPIKAPIKIYGESIELYKNGKVKPGSYLAYSYTKKDFDNLDFLTTDELLLKHYKIFISLFNKCVEDMKTDTWSDWYIKQIKLLFSLLEPTIKKYPEAYKDYLANKEIERYNL